MNALLEQELFRACADSSSAQVQHGPVERLRAENAQLKAAARELYEALRLACGSCIDCDKDCSDCINFNRSWMPTARAALANAGGAE